MSKMWVSEFSTHDKKNLRETTAESETSDSPISRHRKFSRTASLYRKKNLDYLCISFDVAVFRSPRWEHKTAISD